MEKRGDEIHITDTEANAGETSGHMRWVLGIGLVLAIAVLSLIWITGALTQGDEEEEATATGVIASQEPATGTDSIVSDRVDTASDLPAADSSDTPLETVENQPAQ